MLINGPVMDVGGDSAVPKFLEHAISIRLTADDHQVVRVSPMGQLGQRLVGG